MSDNEFVRLTIGWALEGKKMLFYVIIKQSNEIPASFNFRLRMFVWISKVIIRWNISIAYLLYRLTARSRENILFLIYFRSTVTWSTRSMTWANHTADHLYFISFSSTLKTSQLVSSISIWITKHQRHVNACHWYDDCECVTNKWHRASLIMQIIIIDGNCQLGIFVMRDLSD